MPDEPLDKRLNVGTPAGVAHAADLAAPADRLKAVRSAAREVAGRVLADRGFLLHCAPNDHWVGSLYLPRKCTTIPVEVRLPEPFPDVLPKVTIREESLPKRVAHVDRGGTVCVAPTSNVLIDADRPEDLVTEVLRRATEVLDEGLLGETDEDLDAEFQAYWVPTDFTNLLSYCDGDGPARQIVICQLTGGSKLTNESRIVADCIEDVEVWARNVGAKVVFSNFGLFAPVNASVPLALPGQSTRVSEVAHLICRHGTPRAQQLFREAIKRADYPLLTVLSMPQAPTGAGRRLVAVRINWPDLNLLKEAKRGFRPGRVPVLQVLSRIGHTPVERLNLKRVDHAYLVARGGAPASLAQATVTVVGVGAVGSEVARNLAAIGVGHIRLVDPDEMTPENVHRHALGLKFSGYNKALALVVELKMMFPHLDIDGRPLGLETLLVQEPEFLLEADLIVLATGEETLERRLNRLLQHSPPRVHTWLEPLGIGGHAFACGGSVGNASPNETGAGCFECLYQPDDTVGLINRTALTASGQEIRQSLAGCAGTFSPFSPLDARRTAVDATELAARVLAHAARPPVLISWRGMQTDFEAQGYQLSRRARQLLPGAHVEVRGAEIARDDCLVCGVRTSANGPAVNTGTGAKP